MYKFLHIPMQNRGKGEGRKGRDFLRDDFGNIKGIQSGGEGAGKRKSADYYT